MENEPEDQLVEKKLLEFLQEDIGSGDLTTDSVVPADTMARAQVTVRSDGVVAGVKESVRLFKLVGVEVEVQANDGEAVHKDQVIMSLSGQARSILTAERTALNILMRMSGVATLTSRIVAEVHSTNPKVKVACTRKTTPGFRIFEKRAVEIGGGDTHRIRLDDSVLIKTNHIIVSGGVEEAIRKARLGVSFTKKIEAEVRSEDEAIEAAKTGLDILMLDNMPPAKVEQTMITLRKLGLKDRILVEVSGGITAENIKAYAATGVDVISIGALTHSAAALDINLRLTELRSPKRSLAKTDGS